MVGFEEIIIFHKKVRYVAECNMAAGITANRAPDLATEGYGDGVLQKRT